MKKLIVLFTVLSATAAHADVLVSHQVKDSGLSVSSVSYERNARLGRAWININFSDSGCSGGDEGCDTSPSVRAKVEGLSLDGKLGTVVLAEKDAAPVVCARLVKHWYGTRLEGTGACGITRSVETTTVIDDGYDTHEVRYTDLYFGKVDQNGRRGD